MYFADKYEEASFKERLFFDKLIEKHNLFPADKWTYYKTSYLGKDVYDYSARNIISGRRLIIEIKVRDASWDKYIYEKNKHRDLMKIKNEDPNNTTILYVNSTPRGTYFWNIDNIIDDYKLTTMEMNKSTMNSRREKKKKRTYLLDPNDAYKHIDFKYQDKFMIEFLRLEKEKERGKNQPTPKVRCIFDGWNEDKN